MCSASQTLLEGERLGAIVAREPSQHVFVERALASTDGVRVALKLVHGIFQYGEPQPVLGVAERACAGVVLRRQDPVRVSPVVE